MRVNIIGGAEGWENAPMEGECWGANLIFEKRPLTLICEVHDYDWSKQECIDHQRRQHGNVTDEKACINRGVQRYYRNKVFRRKIAEANIPFLSKKAYKDIPKSIRFPIEEIQKRYKTDFYGNVVCYMIAYALYLGYDDFHVYGVRMHNAWEYFQERDSVSFWLGAVIGSGGTVKIYDESLDTMLLRSHTGHMYSYPELKQEIHIGN